MKISIFGLQEYNYPWRKLSLYSTTNLEWYCRMSKLKAWCFETRELRNNSFVFLILIPYARRTKYGRENLRQKGNNLLVVPEWGRSAFGHFLNIIVLTQSESQTHNSDAEHSAMILSLLYLFIIFLPLLLIPLIQFANHQDRAHCTTSAYCGQSSARSV